MHRAAVRLFALALICVVWPEESQTDIEGLGVRAGKGWAGWLGSHNTILTVHRVAARLFALA